MMMPGSVVPSALLLLLLISITLGILASTAVAEDSQPWTIDELRLLVRSRLAKDESSSPCDQLPDGGGGGDRGGGRGGELDGLCRALELCYRSEETRSSKDSDQPPSQGSDSSSSSAALGDQADTKQSRKPSSASVWGYGILCVTLISAMSVMGVGVLPFMSKSFYSSLLTALIGLAVGSLSGSALFHLIPSAFGLADVGSFPHHSYLNVSIVIWGGVYGFFVIERLLKMFMEVKSRDQDVRDHGHGKHHHHHHNRRKRTEHPKHNGGGSSARSNNNPDPGTMAIIQEESRDPILKGGSDGADGDDGDDGDAAVVGEGGEDSGGEGRNSSTREVAFSKGGCVGLGTEEVYEQSKPAMRASFGHLERPAHIDNRPTVDQVSRSLEQSQSPIATVAWMIIFGDGVHNFIDGLSIGAAFSESILTGISVSVAVLCEEFPHELGDFAVLLNSGMTMRQAMSYNFLSACTCYLGLVIGILLGELHMANQYIFALAGGMFLYIALVDMVPELNETVDQAYKSLPSDEGEGGDGGGGCLKRSLLVFLLQNVGISVGIASLFILAKFQDDIQISM